MTPVTLSPQEYYEKIVVKSEYNQEGFLKSSESELKRLLKMSKTREDFQICITGLYNFKGHRIRISPETLTSYIEKSIELGCPEDVLDVDSQADKVGRLPPSIWILPAPDSSGQTRLEFARDKQRTGSSPLRQAFRQKAVLEVKHRY